MSCLNNKTFILFLISFLYSFFFSTTTTVYNCNVNSLANLDLKYTKLKQLHLFVVKQNSHYTNKFISLEVMKTLH